MSQLHGKQIRDNSTSLSKLDGTGIIEFTNATMSFTTDSVLTRTTAGITSELDIVNKEYVDSVAATTPSLSQVLSVGNTTNGNELRVNSGSLLTINNYDFDLSYMRFMNATNTGEIGGIYTTGNDFIIYNDAGDFTMTSSTGRIELGANVLIRAGTGTGNINLQGVNVNVNNLLNVENNITTDKRVLPKLEDFTFDLTEDVEYVLYADRNYKFNSITNIVASPTITILINGSPYTLGNTIATGDRIDIISNIPTVIKIEVENE